jgi:hypothetical protein
MRILSILPLAVISFLAPTPLEACKCLATFTVCSEVQSANMVFIGTVVSIEPAFLDPWNHDRLALLPSAEILRLQQQATPESLEKLRAIYLKLYPNMPEYFRRTLREAHTHEELHRVFEGIGLEGRQARILVKTVFHHQEDDDDDDAPEVDKDPLIGTIQTVWTDAGDCGINFQKDETYLVYADDDEETNQISTSICYRTARLSDAGPDLSYLYYVRNGGDKSTRLEGFVTSDNKARIDAEADRDMTAIASPVSDVVIELKSAALTLHTRTDPGGHFVFDGLDRGDYSVDVFDSRYPLLVKQLGFTQRFHAEARSCVRRIFPKY